MARLRLTLGTRFLRQGQVYVVRQLLVGGQLQVENQSFGGLFILNHVELVSAWAQGDLRFEVQAALARRIDDTPLATDYTLADFQNLPMKLRDEAWRRYQILLPLLRLPDAERTPPAIAAYVESLPPPDTARSDKRRGQLGSALSVPTVQRWLRNFRRSGFDIRALVPGVLQGARKGERRLDQEPERILQAVLAECATSRGHRTVQDVYLMVVNRVAEENRTRPAHDQLPAPAHTTVYRRIQQAGFGAILRRRQSREEAQADASVADGPAPMRILERVEIDHTLLDLFVVDEEDRLPIGRPTLTYALDVASGMPYGICVSFEPPSYRTVAECLLHGILPKPDVMALYGTQHPWLVYGLAEILVVDNAKEFIGQDLRDACAQLGIVLEVLPVRTPWFKGAIERFFRTQNQGLVHSLPGTTFSNMLDRGDYESLKHACISRPAFLKLLHIFLLDYYAQKWHTGRNAIPAKRWTQDVEEGFIPCLHTSAEETRILLMRTTERTVQRNGIEFESLYYRSPDLARLRSLLPANNKTVRIKYDPADLGVLRVFDATTQHWLQVPAADQEYAASLSLWKHQVIRNYVLAEKQSVDIVALAAAKAKIREIVAAEYATTRKQRGRKKAARFLDIGTESEATTVTPAATTPGDIALPAAVTPPIPPSEAPGITKTPTQSRRKRTKSEADTPPATINPLDDPTAPRDEEGWGGGYNLPRKTS